MQKNDDCIAIYSRKSKFTGKGESIGNQAELCREYIRANYGDETVENVVIYEDEGFSGGNLNRPGFKRMMKDAREGKFKVIIVYRLDRISRNISDFSGLIEELSRLNIAFVSIKEQFDTGTPMGRAMMYIASVFSQLERETIAERIRDNMHELAKTGRWLGGTTPTGYASESVKSVSVDGKTKKTCRLKLIPEEADTVRTIYDLFIETNSLTMTEAELMKLRLVSKNGKYFTRFSIKGILQNPVYLIADQDAYEYFIDRKADLFSDVEEFNGQHGILAYNRTNQEKGRAAVFLPVDQWIISVGQHPGLIPGKVWVSVQESLERNKSKAFRRPRSNEALLTGLLYCRCGSRMYPKLGRQKTADGKMAFTYVCKMKERSRRNVCNGKNVNGNLMDMEVIERMKVLEDDKIAFVRQLEQSRKSCTDNYTRYEEQLALLKQEREDIEKKMNSLVDSLIELGDRGVRSHVEKRIGQLHQEWEADIARIQELELLASRSVINDMEFDILCRMLSVFGAGMEEMTVEQKRAAVCTVVRKVIWDGQNAHVILLGAPDDGKF